MKPLSIRRASLAFIAVIALSLMVAPVMVNAQGSNCYGLGDADCQLLQASMNAPKGSLTSFTLNYSIDSKTSGSAKGDTALNLTGTAAFQVNGGISGVASPDIFTNPNAQRLRQAIGKIAFQDTTDSQVTRNGTTNKSHFELRIVNSKLYLNGTQATKGAWEDLDLRTILPLLTRAGRSAGGNAPAPAATEDAAAAGSGRVSTMVNDFKALLQIPNALTATRGTDITIDKQTIAVFVFHVNLSALFSSPAFFQLVKDAQMQNPNKTPMTDDQLKAALATLTTSTQNLKVDISRYVGTTDKLSHGFALDVTGTADGAALQQLRMTMGAGQFGLGSMVSAATASAPAGPVTLDTHVKFTISGIGTAVTVTAPANSKPFNFGALLGGAAGKPS